MIYSRLISCLNKTYICLKPSVQLPGKWKLYEYYTETDDALINFKENQIKNKGQYLEIEFQVNGMLEQVVNLPFQFLEGIQQCTWQVSRNFIKLFSSEGFQKKEVFQYAIVDGTLKMLRKDNKGNIEFFGFFRKVEEPA
jgi:hypothetical protein